MNNPFITNIVKYHHSLLYPGEKRCYKTAFNQIINTVTKTFRSYAKKNTILHYILHSFIKTIGIYPPGTIVFPCNSQIGCTLENKDSFAIASRTNG